MSVTLTELAAKEVQGIIEQQVETAKKNGDETQKLYLRLGVKGGGCSWVQLLPGFDGDQRRGR